MKTAIQLLLIALLVPSAVLPTAATAAKQKDPDAFQMQITQPYREPRWETDPQAYWQEGSFASTGAIVDSGSAAWGWALDGELADYEVHYAPSADDPWTGSFELYVLSYASGNASPDLVLIGTGTFTSSVSGKHQLHYRWDLEGRLVDG